MSVEPEYSTALVSYVNSWADFVVKSCSFSLVALVVESDPLQTLVEIVDMSFRVRRAVIDIEKAAPFPCIFFISLMVQVQQRSH